VKIHKLNLFTKDIDSLKSFYTNILCFPLIDSSSRAFTLQTGASELSFEQKDTDQFYHFAFMIPKGSLEACIESMEAKGIELMMLNRKKIIYFNGGRSIYFYDPAGNNVEFIERPMAKRKNKGPFTIDEVHRLNEIGLPVKEPLTTARMLTQDFGILAQDPDSFTNTFCWVGDPEGVIICTKIRRKWIPSHKRAVENDFEIEFETRKGIFNLRIENSEISKLSPV